MANDEKKRTFDALIMAALEEAVWDEQAAEEQRKSDEDFERVRMAEFVSELESYLDPVIIDVCALRYVAIRDMSPYAPIHAKAVLTVDGEIWTIWTYSWRPQTGRLNHEAARFSFEGPQHRPESVDKEKLQTALLYAIAQRRTQRAFADDGDQSV
jgi:hypothetical protein